ncbi:hypothetical protein C2L92_10920 [Coxiella burnetii]|nr:hypothetical protein CbuQ195_01195 [Coxiella burnetii]PNT78477.1 hypothetical protein C2L92_10920 [Coxiella burnetii]PNT78942.1 hypothetical protein C2L91_10950 [Coxiella burnetii]PNT85612.1 hypothetical protein C2L94_10920 [Coxiella burnetii]
MSEAKYGKTMMSSIVPVFRFAHTGYLVTRPARRRRKPTLSIAPNTPGRKGECFVQLILNLLVFLRCFCFLRCGRFEGFA